MYNNPNWKRTGHSTGELSISGEKPFRILQITDIHFGFGPLSRRADEAAIRDIRGLVHRCKPDLILFTGDMIFPFLPKSGTLNNELQMKRFVRFADSLGVPYSAVFGNHDAEMFSRCTRPELAKILEAGMHSLFLPSPPELTGYSNQILTLTAKGTPVLPLVLLDSNMYGSGWFYGGFDCIHEDQTHFALEALSDLKKRTDHLSAMAFFHMPLPEYKEAYRLLKSGSGEVTYHFGSILEENEYFGITNRTCTFFDLIRKDGTIRYLFCGHDHLNTISMTWKGIRMTYGMSIDHLAYAGIRRHYTQRGGTLITREPGGEIRIAPVPVGPIVSTRVRGMSNSKK
jgi:3',5'-cyclic AMP phosphodiesterase CpdA